MAKFKVGDVVRINLNSVDVISYIRLLRENGHIGKEEKIILGKIVRCVDYIDFGDYEYRVSLMPTNFVGAFNGCELMPATDLGDALYGGRNE